MVLLVGLTSEDFYYVLTSVLCFLGLKREEVKIIDQMLLLRSFFSLYKLILGVYFINRVVLKW